MAEFLFLMHAPGEGVGDHPDWRPYLASLREKGALQGGSAIGPGQCFRKEGEAPPVTGRLSGYLKVTADSLEAARELLAGNPVYEAGGVVEVRSLPVTG